MIIQRYLDKEYYIILRKGIAFHYFGNGCIADYYMSSVAYLDKIDISLVHFCNGTYKLSEIIECAETTLAISKADLIDRMERLYKSGVIVFKQNQSVEKISFSGINGAFYPKEVTIELTDVCNYRCPFCYRDAKSIGRYITTEKVKNIEKMLRAKVRSILLTGGEPTLHPNYQEYIGLFSKTAEVYMISNGSVLYLHDPKMLKKLTHIQFSIYGCDDDEYKKMTGIHDGFSRLVKSIEFSKQNMIPIVAAVTLCDETLSHVEQFVKLAIEFGIDVIRIGIADSFGRGKYLYYSEKSNFSNYKNVILNEILDLKLKYRNRIYIETLNIAKDHIANHSDLCENVYGGFLLCGCGTEHIVISPSGSIRPCEMLPEMPFSIKSERGLLEHVQGDLHKQQLCDAIHEYCNSIGCSEPSSAPCYAIEEYLKEEINHANS